MNRFTRMAYNCSDDMTFGRSKKPVSYGLGIKVGAGKVIPEINYAPRVGTEENREKLRKQYVQYITKDCVERAVNLGFPDLQLETEWISLMGKDLELSASIVNSQKEFIEDKHSRYNINLAVRHTIPDLRLFDKDIRTDAEKGDYPALLIESAEVACENGADVLSIESIGGKEITDYAITHGDITAYLFGSGYLGSIDVMHLWTQLTDICNRNGTVPGGDSNCASANMTMFMAGGFLDNDVQKTFSAIARCISAARTLCAMGAGATGPGKDCGYENIIVKAITGMPMSQEGKSSQCAHCDLVGNLMAQCCDLWSNESVEYHPEFGGTSVQCWTGQIGYECALMNTAILTKKDKVLRDLYMMSDRSRSPESYILSFDNAWKIGKSIVDAGESIYERSKSAAITGARIIMEAYEEKKLGLTKKQFLTLNKIIRDLESLPDDEDIFVDECIRKYGVAVPHFRPENYGL